MTVNHPDNVIERISGMRAPAAADRSRLLPTDLESWAFPAWLDQDPAAREPNYLGYTMLLMPLVLLLMLAVLAFVAAY